MTVRAIMAATTLARPSFYDHFSSRAVLVTELVRPVLEANRAVLDLWPTAPREPEQAVRRVAAALVDSWRHHGALLLALADASKTDEDARLAYEEFAQDSVRRVADRIRAETAAGSVAGIDPDETALALVLMNRSYIAARFDRLNVDADIVVSAITRIWLRVLWPATEHAGAAGTRP